MRRMMAEDPQTRGRIPQDFGRRTTFHDGRDCDDREYKKRKVGDGAYMVRRTSHSFRPPFLIRLLFCRTKMNSITVVILLLVRLLLPYHNRSPITAVMDPRHLSSICKHLHSKCRTRHRAQVLHQAHRSRRVFFPSLVTSSPRASSRELLDPSDNLSSVHPPAACNNAPAFAFTHSSAPTFAFSTALFIELQSLVKPLRLCKSGGRSIWG